MRVLQLGLGRRGKNVLRNLLRLKQEGLIEEVFVYDKLPEVLEAVRREFNVPVGDPNRDYDAAFIVTPPRTHYALAKSFLSRGIPTFIEKPPVLSVEQLDELLSFNVKASTDMLLRYTPIADFLATLKPPRIFSAIRTAVPSKSADVNVMRDLLIHDIDLYMYVFGNMRPYAASFAFSPGMNVETHAFVFLEDPHGVLIGIRMEKKIRHRHLIGKDEVIVDFVSNSALVNGREISLKPVEEPLYLSIKDFIQRVSGGEKAKNSLDSVRKTISVCEEIDRLARA